MEKKRIMIYCICDCCGADNLNNQEIEIQETEYQDVHLCEECLNTGWEVWTAKDIEKDFIWEKKEIPEECFYKKYGCVLIKSDNQESDFLEIKWTGHSREDDY
jgi:hypothetical protein